MKDIILPILRAAGEALHAGLLHRVYATPEPVADKPSN